jgi:hypothetical protein
MFCKLGGCWSMVIRAKRPSIRRYDTHHAEYNKEVLRLLGNKHLTFFSSYVTLVMRTMTLKRHPADRPSRE